MDVFWTTTWEHSLSIGLFSGGIVMFGKLGQLSLNNRHPNKAEHQPYIAKSVDPVVKNAATYRHFNGVMRVIPFII
jgi:hypothetical protein